MNKPFFLKLLGVIFIVIFVILLTSSFGSLGEYTEKEVKCYDKNNNEIIGVKCIEKKLIMDNTGWLFIGITVATFTIGLILFTWGEVLENE